MTRSSASDEPPSRGVPPLAPTVGQQPPGACSGLCGGASPRLRERRRRRRKFLPAWDASLGFPGEGPDEHDAQLIREGRSHVNDTFQVAYLDRGFATRALAWSVNPTQPSRTAFQNYVRRRRDAEQQAAPLPLPLPALPLANGAAPQAPEDRPIVDRRPQNARIPFLALPPAQALGNLLEEQPLVPGGPAPGPATVGTPPLADLFKDLGFTAVHRHWTRLAPHINGRRVAWGQLSPHKPSVWRWPASQLS